MKNINLYRLFAVQEIKGHKLAVYVNDGNYSDPEIMTDAEEIVRGTKLRNEIISLKPHLYKDVKGENRKKLTYYTRLFARGLEVISKHSNVNEAIFVETAHFRDWTGEKMLYYNKSFDVIKTDYPTFSGCEPIETIKI